MMVKPRTGYAGGIERYWSKLDRFDFYNPYFQNIGDQEILNKEVWYNFLAVEGEPGEGGANDTWGYAPRWAEYKMKHSRVSAEMKTSLDFWHMADIYDSTSGQVPPLSLDFGKVNPADDNITRPFAVRDGEDNLYISTYHDVQVNRPMYETDIPM